MKYIDIETLIVMFSTTYKNSILKGEEVARILEVRYGREDEEQSKANASYRSNDRLAPK
jgi:hypothetical protein